MSEEDYSKQDYAMDEVSEPANPEDVLAASIVKVEVLKEGMYHMTTQLQGDTRPEDVAFNSPEGRASVMSNLLVEVMKVVLQQQGSVEGVIEWVRRCQPQNNPLADALAAAFANRAEDGDQDVAEALGIPSVKLGS